MGSSAVSRSSAPRIRSTPNRSRMWRLRSRVSPGSSPCIERSSRLLRKKRLVSIASLRARGGFRRWKTSQLPWPPFGKAASRYRRGPAAWASLALLAYVPDSRPALARYGPVELAASSTHSTSPSPTTSPATHSNAPPPSPAELVSAPEALQPSRRRSQGSDIAGAGFEQTSATAYRFTAIRALP
jgi:hypothetical protein